MGPSVSMIHHPGPILRERGLIQNCRVDTTRPEPTRPGPGPVLNLYLQHM